ncbi:retrovirus-related pol polyprotein from transposon TNT 1-94 [Tanacetum coccineum]
MGYDQEMVPKTKYWVERLNPDSKLPNFNTGRILVLESQAVNESLESTKILNTPESSKDSEAESLTLLPPLKNLQGASQSSEVMPLTFQPHSPKKRPGLDEKVNSNQKTQESNSKIQKTKSSKSVDSSRMSQDSKPKVYNTGPSKILYCMICKREDHRTLNHEMYIASLKTSEKYKAQPYQYASSSKQILKAKAKPFPPCTHYGFNDHIHDDCRNYPERGICGSYDHSTSGHNRVIKIRVGVLAESSQSNESSIGVKCNTCGSTIHSTTYHNEFDHFKKGEKIQTAKRHIREPIWYLDSGCSRSMTGVKSYLHKYVEQPGPKVLFGDNSSCITEGYGSINRGGVVSTKVAFLNGLKYNLINISQLYDAKYTIQFDDKKGTIFNANKEIVLITPRRNDVYVLDMSSLTPNGACFFAKASKISPMSINHEKYTLVIVDEYSRERIPDISYFHVFGCPVFIHNHKDHLGKFDAKADDGYFLGYSFVSKAFRVFNTRRQQVEETYHVTFDESMEAIRFTNTSVDEIGIDDSSRYILDEFQEDDPSRQYQIYFDVSYYIIPHGRPPDLINNEGIHEQNVQNDQMITQPTDVPSGNNTKVLGSITEPLVPDVTQSHISNHASTSSHPIPQDRWSRDQHIELVNIIGDHGKGMLTRSMAAKLIVASASECLFADFLSKIEPKKASEALKHP